MEIWTPLERAVMPDGRPLVLSQSGERFIIRAGGQSLMESVAHGSEEALSRLGCEHARTRPAPVILIGGLGMGYTLRAALDILPATAKVVVSELMPAVVEWNRGPLAHLAGHPLDDPRVEIALGDVQAHIARSKGAFDAMLLDVDNGPSAMPRDPNVGLYGPRGLASAKRALRPGGTYALWSAGPDRHFVNRLRSAGFRASEHDIPIDAFHGKRSQTIFIGQLG